MTTPTTSGASSSSTSPAATGASVAADAVDTTASTSTVCTRQGHFVWHDLMTPAPLAAQRFYSAVLGWQVEEWKGPQPYTMFVASGAPRGGFMELPEDMQRSGVPPHWMSYASVDDVDAKVRQAESMGAKTLVKPQEIPNTGRFAVLQDPQGAAFALYTHSQPMSDTNEMAPLGDASWHELWTSDPAAAYEFYTTLLGWESAGEFDMGPEMGLYRMFGRNGLALGGMAASSGDMKEIPPNWLPYFRVADVPATIEKVKQNGGTVLYGPMEVPGGDIVALFRDPQGGAFAVHAVKP